MPNIIIKTLETPEYIQEWKKKTTIDLVKLILEHDNFEEMDELFLILGALDHDIANLLYAHKSGCQYVIGSGKLSDDFKSYRSGITFKFATNKFDIGRNRVHSQDKSIKPMSVFASWDGKTRSSMSMKKVFSYTSLVEDTGNVYLVPANAAELLQKLESGN